MEVRPPTKRSGKIARHTIHRRTEWSDKATMARFCHEHTEFLHAEMPFYATRDTKKTKQASESEAGVGPSNVDISSSNNNDILEALDTSSD
jgi:hypothetical protein